MIKQLAALGAFLLAILCLGGMADAQSLAKVLATCGSAGYSAGTTNYVTMDTTGGACGSSGTVTVQSNPYTATGALASNLVLKSGAGTLFGFHVVGDATAIASTWYVLVFDATSLPADGAVTPAQCFPVNSGQPLLSVNEPTGGVAFTTGIVVGISSTGCFTQTTLGAHAFISGVAR